MSWDFQKIVVTRASRKRLEVNNCTSYPLIGKGIQGAVFQLSPEQCVKIYADEKHWLKESDVLQASQHLDFIPRVYEIAPTYIIMEYIPGINLKQYLKRRVKTDPSLPLSISEKLIVILKQMMQSGFTKIDVPLRHVIISDDQSFKVVDHVYSMTDQQTTPERLLKNLDELGLLDQFWHHLKEIDIQLLSEWKKAKQG